MSQFFAEHAEEFMKFMMQQAGGTPPVQEPAQPEKSVEPIEPEEFKQNAFPDGLFYFEYIYVYSACLC